MIIQEYPYINWLGEEQFDLVRTYSDQNKKILQIETGNLYSEAVDSYPTKYTYYETNITIIDPEAMEEDYEENMIMQIPLFNDDELL